MFVAIVAATVLVAAGLDAQYVNPYQIKPVQPIQPLQPLAPIPFT